MNKVEKFQGARRIRYSGSAKSLTVFEAGKDKRIIDLEAAFNNENVAPDDKAAYEKLSSSVQTIIFKSFTSTVPLETKKPGTNTTVNDAKTNAERAARLASANQCLEDGDVISFLEQLKNDPNGGHRLAFAYASPLNEAKQPVPLNFVSHFHNEYIKNEDLQERSDNMVFAMPYLVDATPEQAGHYKLVLINFADSTISHYDSLGHAPNAAVKAQLALLAADLNTKYRKAFTVADQGNAVHQTDATSCGHFVLSCVVSVLQGTRPTDFMSGQITADQLTAQKQPLAAFYQDATAPAPVVPTPAPAPSTSGSTAAPVATSTTTTPAVTTGPVAPPLTLTSFEPLPEDEEKAPSGVLGRVASFIPQRVKGWWNRSGSDENLDENFTPSIAGSLAEF